MKTDNRNLGKYDLKHLLRNPMTIHKIQDALLALKDDSLFAQSLRDNAQDKPRQCVQMVCDQHADNPALVRQIVGDDVILMIEEYIGESLSDDLKNINI